MNKFIKLLLCVLILLKIIGVNAPTASANSYEDDLIVFIPGITGTELFFDEEKTDLVWIDPFDLSYLNYKHELYPGLPIGWPGSIINYALLDVPVVYGNMAAYLEKNFEEDQYIVFSYDWRDSNYENAIRLNEEIEKKRIRTKK